MKNVAARACCLLAFAMLNTVGYGQRADFKPLEAAIRQKIDDGEIPSVALAVSRNGKIVYQNAFGWADIANDVHATVQTSYQIASVSKPLTATGIMLLDQRGTIDLGAAAERYTGDLRFADPHGVGGEVTVRHLLNHTSGLGTYFDIFYADEDRPRRTFEEAFEAFGTLHHAPGLISEYSNLGYGLLDYIIAQRSGKPYGWFMQEEVFGPLGLTHTFVQGHEGRPAGIEVAQKYTADLKALPAVFNNTPGAGNVYASVADLLKFGNVYLGLEKQPLLSEKTLRKMQYRDPNALFHYHQGAYYGLGWYVKPDDNGQRVIWHEGGMMGASATLKLLPDAGVAIAVVVNSSNRAACNYVVDELSKLVLPSYEPTPLNERTEIAGYQPFSADTTYFGRWSGTMTVDDREVPLALTFGEDGVVTASYLDYTYQSYFTQNNPLPNTEKLMMAIDKQGSLIGLMLGTLPAERLRQEFSHMLSLKLYKQGNTLRGTVVALPAAAREYYAYPFHVALTREGQ